MALVFALSASTLLLLVVEMLMRGFDEDQENGEPVDSTATSVVATLVWMALLTPLFFSYH